MADGDRKFSGDNGTLRASWLQQISAARLITAVHLRAHRMRNGLAAHSSTTINMKGGKKKISTLLDQFLKVRKTSKDIRAVLTNEECV
jgi:hypothetical protein